MKNYFVLILIIISSTVYGVQFSLGINTVGLGPTFQRGDDYTKATEDMKNSGKTGIKNAGYINSTHIAFQIDFAKHFSTEFGVGYNFREFSLKFNLSGERYENRSYFNSVSIPLIFKVQYEFLNFVNLYAGLGPIFNFNISANNLTYKNGIRISNNKFIDSEYNVFDMDINFVLGVEFNIMRSSYIGIRSGYNLNVLSPIKTGGERSKYYVDALIFHITYRYVFDKM